MKSYLTRFMMVCVGVMGVMLAVPHVHAQIEAAVPFANQGAPLIFVFPSNVVQPTKATFLGQTVRPFAWSGNWVALFGVDLQARTGQAPLAVTYANGATSSQIVQVLARTKPTESFALVATSSSGTKPSESDYVHMLTRENNKLAHIYSHPKKLWSGPFTQPLTNVTITDGYGYIRQGSQATVSHKGVDYRAEIGTPVYSMQSGIVRLARKSPIYGNMIAIDHGQGIQTLYMHLNKIAVNAGQKVAQGERIATSGATGSVTGPHLHISVRVNDISIDPVTFMDIFGTSTRIAVPDRYLE